MPTYDLPTLATNRTLEGLIQYEVTNVPFLGPGILIFIFLAITIAGSFSHSRSLNRSGMAMWMAIGGMISTTVGFVLFLYPGIINLETLVISVISTLTFALLALTMEIMD